MGIGNLDNCPRCGKLYVKNPLQACPSCVKELNAEYEKCAEYLKQNRSCTIHELSESTEVSVKQIARFIREGRISLVGAPNLGYPCESCMSIIRQGSLCEDCRVRLTKGFGTQTEVEQRKSESDKGVGFLRGDKK
jgi:flagellar operon protein (TIGR03826 family)